MLKSPRSKPFDWIDTWLSVSLKNSLNKTFSLVSRNCFFSRLLLLFHFCREVTFLIGCNDRCYYWHLLLLLLLTLHHDESNSRFKVFRKGKGKSYVNWGKKKMMKCPPPSFVQYLKQETIWQIKWIATEKENYPIS